MIHFLNGFFLNNALLIPPRHFFPVARLLLWFAIGAIGHREAYIDTETWGLPERKQKPVEGRFRWLSCAILLTEIILCYKYRADTGNLIDAPTPWYIWLPWSAVIIGCVVFWFYLRFKDGHTVKYPGYEGYYASSGTQSVTKATPSRRRSSPSKRAGSPSKSPRKVKTK